jgi:hypothetical protein
MYRVLIAFFLVSLISASPAQADYAAGCTAYDSGDFQQALKEWKPAAEQGDAKSQFRLGCLYTYGQGVKVDHAQALRWYRQAAEQGDPDAQNNLGGHYAEGLGVEQDNTTAYMWFLLAAEAGNKVAVRNRNYLRSRLNAAEIAKAEEMAHAWAKEHPNQSQK